MVKDEKWVTLYGLPKPITISTPSDIVKRYQEHLYQEEYSFIRDKYILMGGP